SSRSLSQSQSSLTLATPLLSPLSSLGHMQSVDLTLSLQSSVLAGLNFSYSAASVLTPHSATRRSHFRSLSSLKLLTQLQSSLSFSLPFMPS
ncbi:hypothetical protein Ancab_007162, partial [Ancistrocladus abbreviatus]